MTPNAERHPEHVQSLERGLAVIRAFAGEEGTLSLTDVARRCDLTRAAARRFLLTLMHLGYVSQDGRGFALRPRVLELGAAYLSGVGFLDVARPHLEAVSHAVQESASISVLDGDEIVYVARVPIRRIMSVTIANGTRFPAHLTSMGRVLLAARPDDEVRALLQRTLTGAAPATPRTPTDPDRVLDAVVDARRHGYALVDQELEEGLRSVAVPIVDGSGTTVAAMNVAAHAARRSTADLLDEVLPALRAAAQEIRDDLRRTGATVD
ncbi:IclR family transcriptional regulator C-terminal domain-containing protein [Patulibacter sp.]|uniref:IclR family transcriptional regulator domain-containing protein n=1 Tax=Patulibacter sp. TaxID=1912859 RepID=UPI00271ED682|nr:IclR family transcriptional regulator C-terminal domain-containing protein [Patulibacter sp.]MDO9409350.1 IclR family transcriptional regulator C-terminal domain-containing protein [Patulibacter sp.]